MQKKKSGVKNVWKFVPLRGGGGVGCLMANAILNFHFDYLNPSLNKMYEGCGRSNFFLRENPKIVGVSESSPKGLWSDWMT